MTEFLNQENKLSRRDFLRLSAAAAGAVPLAACGVEIPVEIKGSVPGDYSQFIKEHELQPTVFTEYDSPETRKNMAVDFLKRYRDALRDKPRLRGNSLAYFRINTTPDNYPISIPNTDNASWTIYDVVNTFLTEIKKEKITFEYVSTQKKIAGTINSYENVDGRWRRKTKFVLGEDLMKQGKFHESDKIYYTRPTDAELAIILLHEYAHALQDEMILAYLNSDPNALASVGTDSNQVSTWVSQKVDEENDKMSKPFSASIPTEKQFLLVKFNEAQANAAGYYFLYLLNQLNQSVHFPGTRRADPSGGDVKAIKKQHPGIHYVNLYTLFLTEVIEKQDALSPNWLIEAGK